MNLSHLGLLLLRGGAGGLMLVAHGWGKLTGFAEKSAVFADPIGLGSDISLGLAVFAEVFCSALVIVGFKTRLAVIPLIITMAVAVFIVHADDPFARQELGLMYLLIFLTLLLLGPGAWSIDARRARG